MTPAGDAAPGVSAEGRRATPEQIAAAWRAFRGDRPGTLLGPGPAFVEAIGAALAVEDAAQRGRTDGGTDGGE